MRGNAEALRVVGEQAIDDAVLAERERFPLGDLNLLFDLGAVQAALLTATATIDAGRLSLALTDLWLPAIKLVWADFAACTGVLIGGDDASPGGSALVGADRMDCFGSADWLALHCAEVVR